MDAYSTSMEAANRRPTTLKQYRYSMTRFIAYAGEGRKLSTISAQTIEDFMLWLREQGAAASHCNKMRNELAGIFGWGGKKGYVEPGIFQAVAKFSVDKKDVLILSDDEITRLFVAADSLDSTGLGRGMGLFVRIGYYMGLRPGENCALRWDHVDFGQKIIRVSHDAETGFRVKMGKERAVKLYPAVSGHDEIERPTGRVRSWLRQHKRCGVPPPLEAGERGRRAGGVEAEKPPQQFRIPVFTANQERAVDSRDDGAWPRDGDAGQTLSATGGDVCKERPVGYGVD